MLELHRAERHRCRADALNREARDALDEAEAHLVCGNPDESNRLVRLASELDSRAQRHVHKAFTLLERVGL